MNTYRYDPFRLPPRADIKAVVIGIFFMLMLGIVLVATGCASTPNGLATIRTVNIVANDAYQLWVWQYNAKLPVALEAHDTNTVSELHAQKEKVRAALNEYQDAESVLILTATATTNPVVVVSPAVLSALGNLTNIVNAYVH